jgi:hypothetical protein
VADAMTVAYPMLVIGAGVAANLLLAAMFVARVLAPRWSRTLGFAGTAMAAPLAAASVVAARAGGGGWDVVLPLIFVVFAAAEVVVDLLLDVEIRTTRWLWPYLAGFYLAQSPPCPALSRAEEAVRLLEFRTDSGGAGPIASAGARLTGAA